MSTASAVKKFVITLLILSVESRGDSNEECEYKDAIRSQPLLKAICKLVVSEE